MKEQKSVTLVSAGGDIGIALYHDGKKIAMWDGLHMPGVSQVLAALSEAGAIKFDGKDYLDVPDDYEYDYDPFPDTI